jgi:hypothetical protein
MSDLAQIDPSVISHTHLLPPATPSVCVCLSFSPFLPFSAVGLFPPAFASRERSPAELERMSGLANIDSSFSSHTHLLPPTTPSVRRCLPFSPLLPFSADALFLSVFASREQSPSELARISSLAYIHPSFIPHTHLLPPATPSVCVCLRFSPLLPFTADGPFRPAFASREQSSAELARMSSLAHIDPSFISHTHLLPPTTLFVCVCL